MKIRLLLFAAMRQKLGTESVELNIDPPNIAELRRKLTQNYPALKEIVSHSQFAIDEQFVADHEPIPQHATVACIPPVSGG